MPHWGVSVTLTWASNGGGTVVLCNPDFILCVCFLLLIVWWFVLLIAIDQQWV